METADARKFVSAALEEWRKFVIRPYRSGKYKTYQEIEAAGTHRNTASEWIRHWEKAGSRTQKTQQRGRPVGCCRRLSAHEEAQIRKDLEDHCPDQLKLPFAPGTRQSVRSHIKGSKGEPGSRKNQYDQCDFQAGESSFHVLPGNHVSAETDGIHGAYHLEQ